MPWHRVCATNELPSGAAREFVVAGQIIACFCVEGDYFALDGICPHQGGPLGKGTLRGCVVTCPWHGWQFDVRTGQHQASAALRHARYDVKIAADALWVELPVAAPGE